MRIKNYLMAGLTALSFLATSCSNNEDDATATTGEASIVISLEGEKINSRATDPTTDDETDERKILNYRIYVFNSTSGAVEKTANGTVTNGVASATTISGLNTLGTKKVVVIANLPAGFPTISHYSDFESSVFDLNLQNPANRATTGLVMSGESANFSLTAADTEDAPRGISVTIRRVVAKIELQSIQISPAAGRAGVFVLQSVSIQKAKSLANAGPVNITSATPFYGGLLGSDSQISAPYLHDTFASTPAEGITLQTSNYFYVFPNAVEGEETLMTITGTYDGATMHFPFRINRISNEGGGSADGTMIKRNTRYVLSVTLRNLGGGSVDPDLPGDPSAIEVSVTAEGWEGPLTQNVEW